MATIKEIAQRTGVSIGTVDRVLHNRGRVSEETKAKIHAAMAELDYQPNLAAQGLAVRKKKLKIGMVFPETERHPFYADVRKAAEEKARELEQYGVQVFLETLLDTAGEKYQNLVLDDIDGFAERLEQIDGLAILGLNVSVVDQIVIRAQERRIPVVFYNTMLEDRKYLAYVGCDYVKAGALAAGLSYLVGGAQAKICVYSEYAEGVVSHEERMKGFRREIREKYPEMTILDVRLLSQDRQEIIRSVDEMMKTYPDVDVVYVVNPGDYTICEVIHQMDPEHRIRIITNDLVDRQRDMVASGVISATVCQEPEKQGALPLDILFQYLAYEKEPEEKINHTSLSICIAQNI